MRIRRVKSAAMNMKSENLGSELTGRVIAAAIAVHREFGPGLDERDYEHALHLELLAAGIAHECQLPLPLHYKGANLDCGYRMDLVIEERLLLELKAVPDLHPLHQAQLLTYLRLAKLKLGLLMNFGSLILKDGIIRRANSIPRDPRGCGFIEPVENFDTLSREIITAALEVQAVLGSGLLRSAYESCLAHELRLRGLSVEQRLPANLTYRERLIPSSKEIPMVVNGEMMVSCFCVKRLEPIHLASQRSLLKAAGNETGLCLNFHAETLAAEVRRIRLQA